MSGTYCTRHKPEAWRGALHRPLPSNWAATVLRILIRDHYQCYLCGAVANQVDHKRARAEGGTDDDNNLGAICTLHHNRKTQEEAARGRQAAR